MNSAAVREALLTELRAVWRTDLDGLETLRTGGPLADARWADVRRALLDLHQAGEVELHEPARPAAALYGIEVAGQHCTVVEAVHAVALFPAGRSILLALHEAPTLSASRERLRSGAAASIADVEIHILAQAGLVRIAPGRSERITLTARGIVRALALQGVFPVAGEDVAEAAA